MDEHESGLWKYSIDLEPRSVLPDMTDRTGPPTRSRRSSRPPPPRRLVVERTVAKHNEGIIGWAMANNLAASLPQDAGPDRSRYRRGRVAQHPGAIERIAVGSRRGHGDRRAPGW